MRENFGDAGRLLQLTGRGSSITWPRLSSPACNTSAPKDGKSQLACEGFPAILSNHGLKVPEATEDSLNKVFASGDVPKASACFSLIPQRPLQLGLGLMYVKRGPPLLARS